VHFSPAQIQLYRELLEMTDALLHLAKECQPFMKINVRYRARESPEPDPILIHTTTFQDHFV
jgi:hypothetical protein